MTVQIQEYPGNLRALAATAVADTEEETEDCDRSVEAELDDGENIGLCEFHCAFKISNKKIYERTVRKSRRS